MAKWFFDNQFDFTIVVVFLEVSGDRGKHRWRKGQVVDSVWGGDALGFFELLDGELESLVSFRIVVGAVEIFGDTEELVDFRLLGVIQEFQVRSELIVEFFVSQFGSGIAKDLGGFRKFILTIKAKEGRESFLFGEVTRSAKTTKTAWSIAIVCVCRDD